MATRREPSCLESLEARLLLSSAPIVDTFSPSPNPATVGQIVALAATAHDPDSGDYITEVAFYKDGNGDGQSQPEELLGSDRDSTGGWAYDWNTKFESAGTVALLAVAFDVDKTPSNPEPATLTLQPPMGNHAPVVGTFEPVPNPATVGQAIALVATAYDVDAGDSVIQVSFYKDANGNGQAEDAEFIGKDSSSAGGWVYVWDTALESPGTVDLLAVAFDQTQTPSVPTAASVTLNPPEVNLPPILDTFTATPNPAIVGDVLTLSATAHDPNSGDWVTDVLFYKDSNGNGQADDGEFLGKDNDPAGGWTFYWSTGSESPGGISLLAVAEDTAKATSLPKPLAVVLQAPAIPNVRFLLLDSPTAGLTATTLPGQAELHVLEDHTFYGEVWVRSNQGNPANIGGGIVALSFSPTYGRIVSVEPVNANWTSGNDGVTDNAAGTLTGLTRTDATPSAGDDEWVLFARVQFSGKAPVDEAAHAFGPYDLSLNMTQADFTVSGGSHAANNAGADDAQVYSVIYDVDDSGRVLGGDFGVFSAAYRTTVGGAEPPYSTWADFDGSGKVLGGDFGLFSGVYRKYTYEIDFSQLPSRYRPAGWTSGWSVRTLIGGGSGATAQVEQVPMSAPLTAAAAATTQAKTAPLPQSGAGLAANPAVVPLNAVAASHGLLIGHVHETGSLAATQQAVPSTIPDLLYDTPALTAYGQGLTPAQYHVSARDGPEATSRPPRRNQPKASPRVRLESVLLSSLHAWDSSETEDILAIVAMKGRSIG